MLAKPEELFNIYVIDFNHSENLRWGGRPLTVDECIEELGVLWKEYYNGTLDPWCEGRPFRETKEIKIDLEKPNLDGYFQIMCIPLNNEYYSFGIRKKAYGPYFFFNCPNRCCNDYVLSKVNALSLDLSGKRPK